MLQRYQAGSAHVIYQEAGSQADLIRIRDWFLSARHGVPARSVVLFGHGDGTGLNLGDMRPSIDCASAEGDPELYINPGNLQALREAGLSDILAPNGDLLTLCCDAGTGGRRNKSNFLHGMRALFPQARKKGIFGMAESGWVRGVHLRKDLSIRRVRYEQRNFILVEPMAATRL